jgi:histone H2A
MFFCSSSKLSPSFNSDLGLEICIEFDAFPSPIDAFRGVEEQSALNRWGLEGSEELQLSTGKAEIEEQPLINEEIAAWLGSCLDILILGGLCLMRNPAVLTCGLNDTVDIGALLGLDGLDVGDLLDKEKLYFRLVKLFIYTAYIKFKMPAKKSITPKKNSKAEETQITQDEKKRMQSNKKADLIFPVARLLRQMKDDRLAYKVSAKSAVFIATVLEYMTAELLELAGENAADDKKKKKMIKPRHIHMAVNSDEELKEYIGKNVIIPTGGVIPFIHPDLENPNKRKRKGMSATQTHKESDSEVHGEHESE